MPGTKVGGDLSSIPGDYMVKKRIDAHKLCPHLYVFNICAHRYVYTDTLNKQIKCEKKFRKKKRRNSDLSACQERNTLEKR